MELFVEVNDVHLPEQKVLTHSNAMKPPSKIELQRTDWERMLSDVKACLPKEACGLLGGVGEEVREVIPITNILESPFRFRMDPREQVEAMTRLESLDLDLVGIYHSHISGPKGLSQTDIEELTYPGSAYLVWSKLNSDWECHAFIVQDSASVEIPLLLREAAT